MVLIQCGTERGRISGGSTEFVLVDIRVIQIIVVKILLLAPNSPGGVGETGEQQSATNTTHYTSNCSLSAATESGAATFASSIGQ